MLPSCRHTSLLRRLRSWAMRPPRASSGGKMARLKRTTYSSPTPKVLSPSMEYHCCSQLCAQIARIGCESPERPPSGFEEQIVTKGIIVAAPNVQLLRDGEHDVLIRHGQ
jgi:hypothetical protein